LKRCFSVLHSLWIFTSLIVLGILVHKFFPNYNDNEFPLFTDFMLIIFLPCYFSLTWLIVHITNLILKNTITKLVIGFAALSAAFAFSIFIMEFSMIFRIIASSLGFIVSIVYYALTVLIYKMSKTKASMQNT